MFISPSASRETMNGRCALLVCMTLIATGMVLPSGATAESGEDIIIESDMTWEQDMTLSQNIRVINGGSLTFSNTEVTLERDVNIFVEEGSILRVENSEMIATEPPSGLVGYGYCDESNRSAVMIPWDDANKRFEATFRPIGSSSLDGVTAYFGNDSEAMSGTEYTLTFGPGATDVWVEFVGPFCYPVSLSEITLSASNLNQISYSAADLFHRNMMVYGESGFTVSIEGQMRAVDSLIEGGQISTTGEVTINDSVMNRVGPVILSSDRAAIFLGGTTNFTNSTDDLVVWSSAYSSFEWGVDVGGSGGLTDKWERRLAGQRLSFEAIYVAYEITGMHNAPSYSNFSDLNGVSYIKGGGERVVEIAWSDDNTWEDSPIWTEQAVVTITDYRTAWNPDGSGIGDYGGGQFSLGWQTDVVVDQVTPNVEWVSIIAVGDDGNSTDAAVMGDSVAVEAVIANTGTAAAILAIDCNVTSTGVAAELSPTWPNAMIGAGGEETIHFTWRTSTTGEDSLTCRVLTPTQLVDDLAFGGGEMVSSAITWGEAEEEEGLHYIIPIMLALVIGIAIAGYVAVNRMNEIDEVGRSPE